MSLSEAKAQLMLVHFIKTKKEEIELINRYFVRLYNEIGLKNERFSGNLQKGFVLALISSFIKSSNMPKEEKKNLIKELEKAVNLNKI